MKIFAKRTKKKADASAAAPKTVNKSDPVVEELLKKDPSEWNAKERRMVKRHRDRKASEASTDPNAASTQAAGAEAAAAATQDETETEPAAVDDFGKAQDASESNEKPTKKPGESGSDSDSDGDSDSRDSSSSSDHDSDNEAEANDDSDSGSGSNASPEKTKGEEVSEPISVPPKEPEKPVSPAAEHTEDGKDDDDDDNGKVPKDHEIWSVLDKLNSKQKRTLNRKLDRLGKQVLDEVEQEANKILDEVSPLPVEPTNAAAATATAAKRTSADASAETSSPPSKKLKKTKTAADWSHLPAEERLRREEQRRKQKEAAERRARGEDIAPGHKRPLNSARRRANRRKPKWVAANKPTGAPDISDYKRDHHSSGFLHRKNRGGAQNE